MGTFANDADSFAMWPRNGISYTFRTVSELCAKPHWIALRKYPESTSEKRPTRLLSDHNVKNRPTVRNAIRRAG